MYSKRQFRSAFTLVELLVVIAIVGVLLAVLMPALSKARETTMRVRCASNLRQFLISISSYDTAYKSYPNAYNTRGNAFSEWLGQKPGYVVLKNEFSLTENILNCPSQIQKPAMTRGVNSDFRDDDNVVQFLGYFYLAGHGGRGAPASPSASNFNTFNGWTAGVFPARLKGFVPVTNSYGALPRSVFGEITQRQILSPSRQFIANDYGYSKIFSPNIRIAAQSSHLNSDGDSCAGINIAYQDGHVTWTPYITGKSWWVSDSGADWLFYNEDDKPVECSYVP